MRPAHRSPGRRRRSSSGWLDAMTGCGARERATCSPRRRAPRARRTFVQSLAWELEGARGVILREHERMVLDAGGVVIRYGQLYGPGTYYETELPPPPRIEVGEAARRTVPVLSVPAGIVELVESPQHAITLLKEAPEMQFADHETVSSTATEPTSRSMRLLVTGGSGVLGRALQPRARAAGHELHAPGQGRARSVRSRRGRGRDARDRRGAPPRDAGSSRSTSSGIPMRGGTTIDCEPTRRGSSSTPRSRPASPCTCSRPSRSSTPRISRPRRTRPSRRSPRFCESALAAERETARFARGGGRGVVLRLGLLDGPGHRSRRAAPGASARPSTSMTRRARCSRRSLSRAGSTTSAATTNACRTAA